MGAVRQRFVTWKHLLAKYTRPCCEPTCLEIGIFGQNTWRFRVNGLFYIPMSLKFGIAGQIVGKCKSRQWPNENWTLFYIKVFETRYFPTTVSEMESRVIFVCKVCFIIMGIARRLYLECSVLNEMRIF